LEVNDRAYLPIPTPIASRDVAEIGGGRGRGGGGWMVGGIGGIGVEDGVVVGVGGVMDDGVGT
jgi:hypothetical protein